MPVSMTSGCPASTSRARLLEHARRLLAAAGAARGRHDAEGAAVLAAVLDLDEGARAAARSRPGATGTRAAPRRCRDHRARDRRARGAWHQQRASRSGSRVLVLVADHQVHAAERRRRRPDRSAHSSRSPRGSAPGCRARDPADGLAIGEVGARRHRARVDHVTTSARSSRAAPSGSRAPRGAPCISCDSTWLRRQPSVANATVTGAASCAARLLAELAAGRADVLALAPADGGGDAGSSRIAWKARMRGSGGRAKLEPSQSLNGIRLTLPRIPCSSCASRWASSARVVDAVEQHVLEGHALAERQREALHGGEQLLDVEAAVDGHEAAAHLVAWWRGARWPGSP